MWILRCIIFPTRRWLPRGSDGLAPQSHIIGRVWLGQGRPCRFLGFGRPSAYGSQHRFRPDRCPSGFVWIQGRATGIHEAPRINTPRHQRGMSVDIETEQNHQGCGEAIEIPPSLVVVAIYWGSGAPMGSDPDEFLDQHGRGQPDGVGIWYVALWDRPLDGHEVAKAGFSVHHDQALCEALWVDPDYQGRGLGRHLLELGQRLCGANAIVGCNEFIQIDEASWHSPYPEVDGRHP